MGVAIAGEQRPDRVSRDADDIYSGDARVLYNHAQVNMTHCLDLSNLAWYTRPGELVRRCSPPPGYVSLRDLAAMFSNVRLRKEETLSNWSMTEYSESMILCECLCAMIERELNRNKTLQWTESRLGWSQNIC